MALHGDLEAELAQLRGDRAALTPGRLTQLFSRVETAPAYLAEVEALVPAAMAATPSERLWMYTAWVRALGEAAPPDAGRRIAAVQQRLLSDPQAAAPDAWHYGFLLQAYYDAGEHQAGFAEADGMLEPPHCLTWTPTIVAILIKMHGEREELDRVREVVQRGASQAVPLGETGFCCLLEALGRNGALAEMFDTPRQQRRLQLSRDAEAILCNQVRKAGEARGADFLLGQFAAVPTLGRQLVARAWARAVAAARPTADVVVAAAVGRLPGPDRRDLCAAAAPVLRAAFRADLADALDAAAEEPAGAARQSPPLPRPASGAYRPPSARQPAAAEPAMPPTPAPVYRPPYGARQPPPAVAIGGLVDRALPPKAAAPASDPSLGAQGRPAVYRPPGARYAAPAEPLAPCLPPPPARARS